MPAPTLQVSPPHIPTPVTPLPADRHPRRARRDPWALAAALFVAYAVVSLGRYRHMATRSWDLGIFEQAVRGYAHFRAPVVDLKGPGHQHPRRPLQPRTVLLAPLLPAVPLPVTLLIAQAALFALSAVPVTRAAARLLGRAAGSRSVSPTACPGACSSAVDFDFHEICFAVPLIAFALEAVLRGGGARRCAGRAAGAGQGGPGGDRWPPSPVVALRARDPSPPRGPYALGVAVFGVAADRRHPRRGHPGFNSSGSYDYWNKVGAAGGGLPFDGFDTKLAHPRVAAAPHHRAARAAFPAAAGRAAHPRLAFPVPRAALLGHRLALQRRPDAGRLPRPRRRPRPRPAQPPPLAALVRPPSAGRRRRRGARADHHAAAGRAHRGATPTASPPGVDRRRAAAGRGFPDGATVEADIRPISRLTGRCRVFWVGDTGGISPDYIALDNPTTRYRDSRHARQLHPHAEYAVAGNADGYVVLERQTTTGG